MCCDDAMLDSKKRTRRGMKKEEAEEGEENGWSEVSEVEAYGVPLSN